MQYKTVAAPVGYSIKAGDAKGCEKAVAQYADLIQCEAVGGWELDMIQSIPVTEKAGCISALFGAKDVTTYFNMLVFKKQD